MREISTCFGDELETLEMAVRHSDTNLVWLDMPSDKKIKSIASIAGLPRLKQLFEILADQFEAAAYFGKACLCTSSS